MPAVSLKNKESRFKTIGRKAISEVAKGLWGFIPRKLYFHPSLMSLNLALTRICNTSCCFCPYPLIPKSEKNHMSELVFDKIVKHLNETEINRVMLSPDIGEPMLAPKFLEKVNMIRESGIKTIEVTTNATVFHLIGINRLVEGGPDIINISFPGFDREMYRRITKRDFYDQTKSNVLALVRANHDYGRPRKINLWLRGDLGAKELLNFPEMKEIEPFLDDVCVMTEVDDWLGFITQNMLPEGLRIQSVKPRLTKRPCAILFDPVIYPDGSIHICSCRNIVHDPDLELGNIMTVSTVNLLEKIIEIFNRWERGIYPKICYKCSMYCDPAACLAGRLRMALKTRRSMRRR